MRSSRRSDKADAMDDAKGASGQSDTKTELNVKSQIKLVRSENQVKGCVTTLVPNWQHSRLTQQVDEADKWQGPGRQIYLSVVSRRVNVAISDKH